MEMDQQAPLRALSLNLGGDGDKHGAWPARVAGAAETIRAFAADLVLLQAAVTADDGSGPLTALREALPGHPYHAFAAAQRMADGWFGSAVLSRRPLDAIRTIPLTCRGGEDDNARVVLHVTLRHHAQALHVLNAHFSWVAGQAADNLAETLRHATGIDGDLLLVGDLNQTPDSDFADAFCAAGWTDAWAALNAGDGFTFETGDLWGRIDQLWWRGDLAGKVASIEVIGADHPVAMSDHLALGFILQTIG